MSKGTSHDTQPEWSQIHDLGLIYFFCMHSTDDQIDASEMEVARGLVAKHMKLDAKPEEVSQILHDALLMYISDQGEEMLAASVISLGQAFDADQRIGVLRDLADLVAADGMVYPKEVEFIAALAEQWDVKNFFRQGN